MGERENMSTSPQSVCPGISELDKIACKLDAVLSSMADGFFIIADDWKVTYANRVVLSYPAAGDIVGKNILHQYSRIRPLLKGLLKARKSKVPVRCDAFIDFAGIWLELNIHPLPGAELAVYARDPADSAIDSVSFFALSPSMVATGVISIAAILSKLISILASRPKFWA